MCMIPIGGTKDVQKKARQCRNAVQLRNPAQKALAKSGEAVGRE